MKSLTFLTGVVLATAGCSTVLVSHVHSTDYETPGVRYFLPAPYLLVKSALELSRTETLYAMSPIDKTVLRQVMPCDDQTVPCKTIEPSTVPAPPPPPTPGAPPVRPPTHPSAGAQAGGEGGDREDAGGSDRWGSEAAESKASREEAAAATAIVWLPDYCQQYTIIEKDHVGSQKVQIQLADGWKISALNTEVNNSEVFQKMIEALSNIAGASINPTGKAASAGAQAASAAQSGGAQGGRTRLFRRVRTVTLKPGIYPLLQYPQNRDNEPDCSRVPSFRPPRDALQPSESWHELGGSRDNGQPVAVEPGRLANPGKPARP